MLPIRANANVIINENNIRYRELLAYYNLEQYPETLVLWSIIYRPILWPHETNLMWTIRKTTKEIINPEYEIINDWKNSKQNYNSEHAAFLQECGVLHAENYMMFTGC